MTPQAEHAMIPRDFTPDELAAAYDAATAWETMSLRLTEAAHRLVGVTAPDWLVDHVESLIRQAVAER